MAVAQAQHALREMTDLLKEEGVSCAIHLAASDARSYECLLLRQMCLMTKF